MPDYVAQRENAAGRHAFFAGAKPLIRLRETPPFVKEKPPAPLGARGPIVWRKALDLVVALQSCAQNIAQRCASIG